MMLEHPMITYIENTGYPKNNRKICWWCEDCGEPIYSGEEYIIDELNGDIFCISCFNDRFTKREAEEY